MAVTELEPLPGVTVDRAVLGQRLRELRERRGVSQSALADAIGESQSTFSQMERGVMEIPAAKIPEICEAIDCTFEEFFQPPSKRVKPRGRGRPPKGNTSDTKRGKKSD